MDPRPPHLALILGAVLLALGVAAWAEPADPAPVVAAPRCPPNSNSPKCQATTTTSSTTSTSTTSTSTTTTQPGTNPPDHFPTIARGQPLPSGATCAGRVDPAAEQRSRNLVYNHTLGQGANDTYPRADGNFTGTTDEILQWVACKWGIDEDVVRSQTIRESYWFQEAGGDVTNDPDSCAPPYRSYSPCPESIGVLQVRWDYHGPAFENENAIRSTAYNADYTYAHWRACFEGQFGWLNNVEHGRPYPQASQADQLWGCVGVWFSGRWYTDAAVGYIGRVQTELANRVWTSPGFASATCGSCYLPGG